MDYKIRKDITIVLEREATRIFKETGSMPIWYDKAIAWLEKQGEQKLDGTFVNVDAVRDNFINEVYGVLNSKNDIGRAIQIIHAFDSLPTLEFEKQGKNNMGISEATKQELKDNLNKALEKETPESWNEFLEKQGEQNPDDKVEPKFKVGDLIIHNIASFVYKVKTVGRHEYCVISLDGKKFEVSRSKEDSYHLWTIQDAKDGDVLVLNNEVFIYAHRKQMYSIAVAHCFVDSDGSFYLDGEFGYKEYGKTISPATKEQRDQLDKAMADAGYTFDFEKKELKKIEQKSDTDFSDLRTWKYVVDAVLTKENGIGNYLNSARTEAIAKELQERFGKIEQKPDDSYCKANCKGYQETGKCFADGECKAKREAMQKPAWGEDDERIRKSCIYCFEEDLEEVKNDKYGHSEIISDLKEEYREKIDWLKSLRPHWKPSEEQVEALKKNIEYVNVNNTKPLLEGLLKQLKKLMEE